YGSGGRTERVARVLRLLADGCGTAPSPTAEELRTLLSRLQKAETRAAQAEALERAHQDYWATRYAEKVASLERQRQLGTETGPRITHQEYLELHRRIAKLSRRLARYEEVDAPEES